MAEKPPSQAVCREEMVGFSLFGGRLGEVVAVQAGQVGIVALGCVEFFTLKLKLNDFLEGLGGDDSAPAIDAPRLRTHVRTSLLGLLIALLEDLLDNTRRPKAYDSPE